MSFLTESQKVYVTNLYYNLGCPSSNSRFRNVVSRSPIYTHNKKFWVILELECFENKKEEVTLRFGSVLRTQVERKR